MREITQVGPTCHQKSPYMREAEGDLEPHTVEKERQRVESCGHKQRVTRGWKRQGTDSALQPLEGALPKP